MTRTHPGKGHGGLVKDLLAKGLETEVVFTPDDLEDLLARVGIGRSSRRGGVARVEQG